MSTSRTSERIKESVHHKYSEQTKNEDSNTTKVCEKKSEESQKSASLNFKQENRVSGLSTDKKDMLKIEQRGFENFKFNIKQKILKN